MARNIYIKKANLIEKYVIYEKTEEGAELDKGEFIDRNALVDYLLNSNEDYINKIRKRGKRVLININIPNGDIAENLEKILKKEFRVKILNSKK